MTRPLLPVYVLDEDQPERPWNKILGDSRKAALSPDKRIIIADGVPVESGIVIMHRSHLRTLVGGGDLAKQWISTAASTNASGPYLIVISGDPQPDAGCQGRVCVRRAKVLATEDPWFADCFSRFRVASSRGNPDFSLLEPAAFDDELIAAFVAASVAGESVLPLAGAPFWDAARLRFGILSTGASAVAAGFAARGLELDELPNEREIWPGALDAPEKRSAFIAAMESLMAEEPQ